MKPGTPGKNIQFPAAEVSDSQDREGVEVRRGRPADLAAVLRLQSLCPEAGAWPREAWADVLAGNHRRAAAVAVRNGAVAGFLLAQELPEGDAEILMLAVDPEHRRRGVATRLVEELTRRASGKVFLEVRAANRGARRFYEALGFVGTGLRRGYYQDPEDDAVLMERAADKSGGAQAGIGETSRGPG